MQGKNKGVSYLLCPTPGCSAGAKFDLVEQAVLLQLQELARGLEISLSQQAPPDTAALDKELAQTREQLGRLGSRRERLYTFLEDGTYTREVFAQRMAVLSGDEERLRGRIEELEVPDINKYDMLLCPDDSRYEKFRGYPLGSERYLLALPAHHPLARREPVDLKALEGQPMVFLSSPGHWLEEPYYLCAGLNLHPATRCLVNDREGHRQVVAAGLALGFVPEGAAAPYRADTRIALARLASGRFARPLMLCFKREKHLSPVGLEFQAFALDFFGVGKEGNHAHRHDS